ncbi:heavy metal-associated isoprenylated plant protein 9-like [Cucurbita maxima]|uniref:Heavy metal-associated isoprenylated plant protein 9-like n=1 Tax=Cucurbita maxima TaxID=3661 RepID=A0A6J1HXR0_CUCMA|nr:heavy metal-associated isoprenylated plant protein 9-like [Cucurbita maxima]
MGEEAVKMEEAKVEETKEELKVEKPKPCPPSVLLFVDLHCTGCAKKIEKSLMRITGVEGVSINVAKNELTIKGIVDPHAVCAKITKKTKRVAKVLSPLPPAEGEPTGPQLVNSQVGGLTVVELKVNMHCEACALQLKRKILKMRGVQTAWTELSTGKVVVTGSMDGSKLVEYVYRRTKKQARIVPQPEPPQQENKPPQEEPPKAEEKKEDEAAAAAPPETKTEDALPQGTDTNNNKEEEQPKPTEPVEPGEPAEETKASSVEAKQAEGGDETIIMDEVDPENMKRMIYHNYQYQSLYVIEPIPPPPQLFSDENPNACCIQ